MRECILQSCAFKNLYLVDVDKVTGKELTGSRNAAQRYPVTKETRFLAKSRGYNLIKL